MNHLKANISSVNLAGQTIKSSPHTVKECWRKMTNPGLQSHMISNYGRILKINKFSENRFLRFSKDTRKHTTYHVVIIKRPENVPGDKKYIKYYVHRLVAEYFLLKPNIKYNIVDHIDGNGQNNYFRNLRYCDRSQNRANSKKSNSNTGIKNIYKGGNKFIVQFSGHKKLSFDNLADAVNYRNSKDLEIHGEFSVVFDITKIPCITA